MTNSLMHNSVDYVSNSAIFYSLAIRLSFVSLNCLGYRILEVLYFVLRSTVSFGIIMFGPKTYS